MKIKYSYKEERYSVRDTFYKDRSFLMDRFTDYRVIKNVNFVNDTSYFTVLFSE